MHHEFINCYKYLISVYKLETYLVSVPRCVRARARLSDTAVSLLTLVEKGRPWSTTRPEFSVVSRCAGRT